MRSLVVVGFVAAVAGAGVSFAQEAPTPSVVGPPHWLTKPSGADVDRVYPRRAQIERIAGKVTMSCGVDVEGALVDCQTTEDVSEGFGFGEAALKLVPAFRMSKTTSDGHSVAGGRVGIPLTFWGPGTRFLIHNPMWARAPSVDMIAAAFPTALGAAPSGEAILRCRLSSTGQPTNCRTQGETPAGAGVAKAALGLTDEFRAAIDADKASNVPDVLIEFPIRLLNPAMPPAPVAVADLQWVTTLSPEGAARRFPAQARASGLDNGLATVDCAVGADGKLGDCKVLSEAPAAQGFADAALKATEVMQLSPWTKKGDALAGRRVTLPIRLRLAEAEAPKP